MSEQEKSDISENGENENFENEESEAGETEIPEPPTVPVIIIRSDEENIRIVAKKRGEVSIQDINPKLILATLWWEGEPQLEKFFQIIELTIKRALREVHPHEKLVIDYIYYANDTLEDASEITVEINHIEADGTVLEVEGDMITLCGNDDRGFFKKLTAFRRKAEEHVHREL